jgi:hypothetical protein
MALWKKNEVSVDLAHYRHYWRAPKKWGKTTMFANLIRELYGNMDCGLLISCGNERGYSALDSLVYVDCPEWSALMEVVDELVENKADNEFKLIAFDTVDELVSMAQREVIRLEYRKSGERKEFNACLGGYGAGRKKVEELINAIITRLGDSGYGLIFIGHTKIRDIKEKNGDEYQMLTSNLSSDYDGIFANKADICMMGIIEKSIDGGFVQEAERYMVFRGDGYVDAGGRFADIESKVEVSAKNYIKTVTDAIRKSIKSHDATDEYIKNKMEQEQKEREEYYQANREKLMQDEPEMNEYEKNLQDCKKLQDQIKAAVASADQNTKKELQAKLKVAGLPVQYQKVTDTEVLNKILSVVTA